MGVGVARCQRGSLHGPRFHRVGIVTEMPPPERVRRDGGIIRPDWAKLAQHIARIDVRDRISVGLAPKVVHGKLECGLHPGPQLCLAGLRWKTGCPWQRMTMSKPAMILAALILPGHAHPAFQNRPF